MYAGADPALSKPAFRALLDRIDLHVEVPPVRVEDIERAEPGESSGEIKKRVNAARRVQNQRFVDSPTIHCNAQMGAKLIKEHCPLDQDSSRLLHQAIDRLGLSAGPTPEFLKSLVPSPTWRVQNRLPLPIFPSSSSTDVCSIMAREVDSIYYGFLLLGVIGEMGLCPRNFVRNYRIG